MAVLLPLTFAPPPPPPLSVERRRQHFNDYMLRRWYFFGKVEFAYNSSSSRIQNFQDDGTKSFGPTKSEVGQEDQNWASDFDFGNLDSKTTSDGSSLLSKLGLVLGIAAVITLIAVFLKQPKQGTSVGIQYLIDGSSASTLAAPAGSFSFRIFGYRIILPEYAPGMRTFISEEALNIWVGIFLARLLSLDGTWESFVDSLSRNAPYMISTVVWVYWGVCISGMIPFYIGKFFRQSGASVDVCSKLGVSKEKAMGITHAVRRHGNLIGFVERFSLGVRNPTSFLAGAMGISPACFFAGVCCGGLLTLPLQLGIGFLLREHPIFALATVATVVVRAQLYLRETAICFTKSPTVVISQGIWTVFPCAIAAVTALVLYFRNRRYSS